MSSISKFVINRNNLEYLYTEKIQSFDGLQFWVYNGLEPIVYYPDAFYATYGNDAKLSIANAAISMEKQLIMQSMKSDSVRYIYMVLNEIKSKINGKDYYNPNLGKSKISFLEALKAYNQFLVTSDDEMMIDYEEEYAKLKVYFEEDSSAIVNNNQIELVSSLENSKIDSMIYSNNQLDSNNGVRIRMIDEQEIA